MMKYFFFLVFKSGDVVVWLLCDGCMAISGLTNGKGGGKKRGERKQTENLQPKTCL